jgi:hypothetical protein
MFTKFIKELIDFAKYLYIVSILVLLLAAILEIKNIYQIDLIPGIDTPFDNIYFTGKEHIENSTKIYNQNKYIHLL